MTYSTGIYLVVIYMFNCCFNNIMRDIGQCLILKHILFINYFFKSYLSNKEQLKYSLIYQQEARRSERMIRFEQSC